MACVPTAPEIFPTVTCSSAAASFSARSRSKPAGEETVVASGLSQVARDAGQKPMDGPDVEANPRLALSYCLENPRWRLSLQVHKILEIP